MSKYTPEEEKRYFDIVEHLLNFKGTEEDYAKLFPVPKPVSPTGATKVSDCPVFDTNTNGDSVIRIDLDKDCPMEEPEGIISFDTVGKPKHYNYGEVEVLDYIEQVVELYPPTVAIHVANVIKYLSRAPLKNGVEDLEKAQYYLDRAIRNIKEQGIIVKLDETK